MSRRIAAAWIALTLTALGCGGSATEVDPFPGYPVAVATNDCGPAGGAAIALVLRPEPGALDAFGPQIRVTIWREFGEVSGKTFASEDQPVAGSTMQCDRDSVWTERSQWRVSFDKAGPDSTLTGVLEIRYGDRATSRGRFHASWHPRVIGCI